MTNLIITLIVGIIGGLLALRFRIPAGAMIGAMIAVALFNVFTGDAFLPQNVRIITQIAAGAFIGAKVRYKDVQELRLMIKPALLMITAMIILNLIMGYIMYRVTEIDLITSLFACAPGGIIDMSLISSDLGADSSKVAVLQLVRLMSVMIIFPPLLKFISFSVTAKDKVKEDIEENLNVDSINIPSKNIKSDKFKYWTKEKNKNLFITTIVAAIGGLVGSFLRIPAGAMTLAMIAVAALNITTERAYMPLNIRRLTQILAGILIGSRMTYTDLVALKTVIVPALILLIGMILVNLFLGFFISKISNIDLVTCLFASTPGGVSDMALIAEDLGADAPKVAILQLTRYVCVIAFFPIIIKFICSLIYV